MVNGSLHMYKNILLFSMSRIAEYTDDIIEVLNQFAISSVPYEVQKGNWGNSKNVFLFAAARQRIPWPHSILSVTIFVSVILDAGVKWNKTHAIGFEIVHQLCISDSTCVFIINFLVFHFTMIP